MKSCVIHPLLEPVDPALIERLRGFETSILSDAMLRFNALQGLSAVAPVASTGPMIGPAFTVRVAPGDNLAVYKALEMCLPGDVIVIDAGGFTNRAIVGEILVQVAEKRQVAGIVVDGAVRDVRALSTQRLPIYTRGIAHLGPYKNGPGELRGTISVGGAPVVHGDIIVADEDGVVRIPRERVAKVADEAGLIVSKEAHIMSEIEHGKFDISSITRGIIEEVL